MWQAYTLSSNKSIIGEKTMLKKIFKKCKPLIIATIVVAGTILLLTGIIHTKDLILEMREGEIIWISPDNKITCELKLNGSLYISGEGEIPDYKKAYVDRLHEKYDEDEIDDYFDAVFSAVNDNCKTEQCSRNRRNKTCYTEDKE